VATTWPGSGRAALGANRQGLPFRDRRGTASLADLFRGRSQLLIYHFMFGPEYTAGCPNCSAIADGFNGSAIHLANHDVTLAAVSRAPLAKLQAYKRRMGWSFPWASSSDSDFNYDFNASYTEEQQRSGVEYNYRKSGVSSRTKRSPRPRRRLQRERRSRRPSARTGRRTRARPRHECVRARGWRRLPYLLAYARGLDGLWAMYQWLDRAPRGRNETRFWIRRHDEYGRQ